MPGQEDPDGSRPRCNFERVLRIVGQVVHVLGGAEAGLPRLVHGVGVLEQGRVPVHVDHVVKLAERVVVDLKGSNFKTKLSRINCTIPNSRSIGPRQLDLNDKMSAFKVKMKSIFLS